jgi:putative ABC transport system ATP-binding protein
MSFIITKNITKDYHLGKTIVNALRGIDLEITKGEYVCIAGPSGSGKTTLLNIIGLLDSPSGGTVLFDDQNITAMKEREVHKFRKRRIGFIFQSFNLVPVLNAYENIEFPLLLQKVSKDQRIKRIEQITEEVGIREYLKHKPDELSGGQRQRVAIARALVFKPEVILADEPTANLDSVTGSTILALMKKLNKEENTTFVIASHDAKIMSQADRLIKVADGRIENS